MIPTKTKEIARVGIFIALLAFVALGAAVYDATAQQTPWKGQLRTGVMVGDSGAPTDFFMELFIPLWSNDRSLFFFNPHFRLDDDDGSEKNIGLGGRTLLYDGRVILGVNAFYDRMRSEQDNEYDQFAVGFEALSHWVDFRANYYQPFGTKRNFIADLDEYRFGSSSLLVNRGVEEALKGGDAEVGFLIPYLSDYVETRVYGGGYYYYSKSVDNIDGWRGRLEIRPNRLITLMAETSHDDLRGTDSFFGGYLDIPFSLENLVKGRNPFEGIGDAMAFGKGTRTLRERMTERIVRDRHIVAPITREKDAVKAAGINEMIYVDGDNATAGTGTLEDPYQTIAQALADSRYKAGTWIYVQDAAAPYAESNLALAAGTTLWGQGYTHPLFKIGGGVKPVINGGNLGNDVLIIADVNEVMGLQIENGNNGIYGQGVKRTSIHDNLIQNNAGNGIYIDNNTTPFTAAEVAGQTLTYTFAANQILNNGSNGIYLNNYVADDAAITGTGITTSFAGNTIEGNSGGIYIYNYVEAPLIQSVPLTNTFSVNTISNNGSYGVELYNDLDAESDTAVGGSVTASITSSPVTNYFTGNTVEGNSSAGISVENYAYADAYGAGAVAGDVKALIQNSPIANVFTGNVVNDNGSYGIYLYTDPEAYAEAEDATVGGQVIASVENSGITNVFTGNTVGNIVAGEGDDGDTYLGNGDAGIKIEDNLIYAEAYADGSTAAGVSATVSGSPFANIFTNNTMKDNEYAGICFYEPEIYADAEADGSSSISGDVTARVSGSPLTFVFSGNDVEANGGHGISIQNPYVWAYAEAASAVNLGATVTNSGMTSLYTGNTLSGNANAGTRIVLGEFYAETEGGSNITGAVSASIDSGMNNTFNGNIVENNEGGCGISINGHYVYAEAYSSSGTGVTASVTGGMVNTFAGNTITGNATYGVKFNDNEIYAYAEGDGFDDMGTVTATVAGAGMVNTFASNAAISGNGDAGVYIYDNDIYAEVDAYEGGSTTLTGNVLATVSAGFANTFTANTLSENGESGIEIDDLYLDAYADVGSTHVTGNVSAAITGGIVNLFSGNTVAENGDDGIYVGYLELYADTHVDDSTIGGNVEAGISGGIANTFTSNTVRDNASQGIYLYENYIEANTDSDYSHVDGDVTASVTGSGIVNTFTSNTVADNLSDGIVPEYNEIYAYAYDTDSGGETVVGDLTATITAGISNTFAGNTITGNAGYGVNFNDDREIYAEAEAYGTEIGGDVTASIGGPGIMNTFTGNTISGNASGGVYDDYENYIEVDANAYSSSVNGNVTASITAGVTNTYTGNTVTDNGGDGIYLYENYLGAETDVSGSGITGDVTATVTGVIANTFTSNTVTGNAGNGIYLYNELWAEAGAFEDVAEIDGNLVQTIVANIRNVFTGNTISNNTDDGIAIENWLEIGEGGYGGILTGTVLNTLTGNTVTGNGGEVCGIDIVTTTAADDEEGLAVEDFLSGNRITGNFGNGVSLIYSGWGNYTADLGGGALGSTGYNSLTGNDTDLYNNTGTTVSAQANWWGQATSPEEGQIDNENEDDDVDFSNWLQQAP